MVEASLQAHFALLLLGCLVSVLRGVDIVFQHIETVMTILHAEYASLLRIDCTLQFGRTPLCNLGALGDRTLGGSDSQGFAEAPNAEAASISSTGPWR